MIDIKQYLEETNTVLLTKEAFECLKESACVLDKIRAEIDHMIPCSKETLSMKLGVLEIIDKYKAESEGKTE